MRKFFHNIGRIATALERIADAYTKPTLTVQGQDFIVPIKNLMQGDVVVLEPAKRPTVADLQALSPPEPAVTQPVVDLGPPNTQADADAIIAKHDALDERLSHERRELIERQVAAQVAEQIKRPIGELMPDEPTAGEFSETVIFKFIKQLQAKGFDTQSKVASELDKLGVRKKGGARISQTVVSKIVRAHGVGPGRPASMGSKQATSEPTNVAQKSDKSVPTVTIDTRTNEVVARDSVPVVREVIEQVTKSDGEPPLFEMMRPSIRERANAVRWHRARGGQGVLNAADVDKLVNEYRAKGGTETKLPAFTDSEGYNHLSGAQS